MKISSVVALAAAILIGVAASPVMRPQPAAPPKAVAPQLVILDTDIGDDIDDAFALALLLHSPEVKLLGVTTAFGDTELRARLVNRYLQAVGQMKIPVVAGVPTQANNLFTQRAYAEQKSGALRDDICIQRLLSVSQAPVPKREKDRYDECEKELRDAPGFILSQIRAHPGQITLIGIGPLFNVQAAIARDPATFRKLKRVVIMGGSVYRGYDGGNAGANAPPSPEWNIRCDPAGARALLASGVPVFMMPLDSTQIRLAPQDLGALFSHGSALTDQLTLLYHQWTSPDTWRMPTLYDPVAATYAIRPDICAAKPMRIDVDDKGFTRPVSGVPNAQVCLKSDEKAFLDFLLRRILADEPH
jgi:inosine-uridine nucleoside N-ribohydrolase